MSISWTSVHSINLLWPMGYNTLYFVILLTTREIINFTNPDKSSSLNSKVIYPVVHSASPCGNWLTCPKLSSWYITSSSKKQKKTYFTCFPVATGGKFHWLSPRVLESSRTLFLSNPKCNLRKSCWFYFKIYPRFNQFPPPSLFPPWLTLPSFLNWVTSAASDSVPLPPSLQNMQGHVTSALRTTQGL